MRLSGGIDEITAFVLAGGKSTRMGSDKAFVRFGNGTLLSHALQLAGSVARNVYVIGDAGKFGAHARVIEDEYHDRGPLGGIHAALSRTATDLNLMLAVDLPFVESRWLQYLLTRARESQAVVTVPRAGGGLQPLCAVYRREFASTAEGGLREGKNKIDPLFAQVTTKTIEEEELAHAGFTSEMFCNLNTPQDVEKASYIRSRQVE